LILTSGQVLLYDHAGSQWERLFWNVGEGRRNCDMAYLPILSVILRMLIGTRLGEVLIPFLDILAGLLQRLLGA
jgi:hypothetical protein